MIDELPLLAALGPYTEQGVEIRDAAELRVKESDRIEAMAENLRRMGARVQVYPDGLAVEGRQTLRGAHVDSRGNHHRGSRMRGGFLPGIFRDARSARRTLRL